MKDISRIIFYSNKGETPYREGAYIEYNDGTSSNVSKKDGISLANSLVKSENKTFSELRSSGVILFVHKNKLNETIKTSKEKTVLPENNQSIEENTTMTNIKKTITKIIFHSNKGETPYKEEAYIEYSDGKKEYVSKKEGLAKVNQLQREQGKKFSELKQSGIISFMHSKKLTEYLSSNMREEKVVERDKIKVTTPSKIIHRPKQYNGNLSNKINDIIQEYNYLRKQKDYFNEDEIEELDELVNNLLNNTKEKEIKKILRKFRNILDSIRDDIVLDSKIDYAIRLHEDLKKHPDILSKKDYKDLQKLLNNLNKTNENGTYSNVLEKYNIYRNKIDELFDILNSELNKDSFKDNKDLTKKEKNIKKRIKKTILFLLLSFGIGAAVGMPVKSIINNSRIEHKNKDEDEENKDEVIEIFELSKLLGSKQINDERKQFIKENWDYLIDYNSTFAYDYTAHGSRTRLSHTFEEIMLSQLIFNDYNNEELQKIFGSYTVDVDKMIDAYKKGVKQDKMAHIIQTKSTRKQALARNNEVSDFYTKYESQMISFNINDKEEKIKIAKEFYNMVRQDFDFKNTDIDNYKLSVIPIIKAMDEVCSKLNDNFTLNEKEKKYFDEDLINSRIKTILNSINSNASNYKENEIVTFEELMNIEIKDAISNKIYRNEESKRNISDHSDYIENINIFKGYKIKKTNKTVKKTNKAVKKSNVNNNDKDDEIVGDQSSSNKNVEDENTKEDSATTKKKTSSETKSSKKQNSVKKSSKKKKSVENTDTTNKDESSSEDGEKDYSEPTEESTNDSQEDTNVDNDEYIEASPEPDFEVEEGEEITVGDDEEIEEDGVYSNNLSNNKLADLIIDSMSNYNNDDYAVYKYIK